MRAPHEYWDKAAEYIKMTVGTIRSGKFFFLVLSICTGYPLFGGFVYNFSCITEN